MIWYHWYHGWPVKIRQVVRHQRKVWEADVPVSKAGVRKRFFADTKEAVIAKARTFIEQRGAEVAFGELSPTVYAIASRWSAPERLTGEEIDAACREFFARKGKDVTAEKAADSYVNAPRETPLSTVYLVPLKIRLKSFKLAFRGRKLSTITPGELADFYRGKGRSAPDYFSSLRAVFQYAYSHEWIVANPFDRLSKPDLTPIDKALITPEEMKRLLRIAAGVELGAVKRSNGEVIAARHDSVLRELVLGGFCGLRHSEIMRQLGEEIDRDTWEVHVTKMKTQKRGIRERYVQTLPNAQAWLKWLSLPGSGKLVTITERNLQERRRQICSAAGMAGWPDNGLRRSFASYFLASLGDAASLAEMLGHTDARTTKAKYRVARKKEVADAWLALTPESVFEG